MQVALVQQLAFLLLEPTAEVFGGRHHMLKLNFLGVLTVRQRYQRLEAGKACDLAVSLIGSTQCPVL